MYRNIAVAALFIAAFFPLTPQGQTAMTSPNDKDERELIKLVRELLGAYEKGDEAAFDRFVADDFIITDEDKLRDKEQEKAYVKTPGGSVNATVTADNLRARVYGDAAVVTGVIMEKVQVKDLRASDNRYRFTDTFVRRRGRWQLVARHINRTPQERAEVKVNPRIYDAYVGQYELAPGLLLDITREGDKLFSQVPGRPKFELFPESETVYFVKDFDARVTFVKAEGGQVTQLILDQGAQKIPAKKIR